MLVIKTSIKYQVAKKTKERKINLRYLNSEEETTKKKAVRSKKNKKKIDENKEKDNELFSFDNEIVIGVTKKTEPKKQVEKKSKNKNSKKKSSSKKVAKAQVNNKSVKKPSSKNNNKNQVKKDTKNLNKKKRKITHIIKYGTLTILFISVVLCAMFSPLFNIKVIDVEGNEKISKNEIISLSQIQIEENTFKISKNKIVNQIKENAYIDEVTIKRKLPSSIVITIEERKPAYLLEYANGYVYLDKQGYMLEINSEKLELPILQGASTETSNFATGNRLCMEDLEKLSTLIKVMELAKVNEISSLITRIDIENKQNIKLIFETKDKVAYLGDATNLIDKIPLIKKILEDNESKAGEIFVNMDLNKENPIFRERV